MSHAVGAPRVCVARSVRIVCACREVVHGVCVYEVGEVGLQNPVPLRNSVPLLCVCVCVCVCVCG